ncbi:unnamed protein product [Rhizophagus irregularis]|nr:unnamed protein product [Rhizophagus irregularis]
MKNLKKTNKKGQAIRKDKQQMEENVFYSKTCVTRSIKFAAKQPSKEDLQLLDSEKFSYFLATILARDRKVVAVNMTITPIKCKVYIAKNGPWSQKDKDFIKKIEKTLIKISKDALIFNQIYERDDIKELYLATMKHCSHKLGHRLNKLRTDITNRMSEMYIKSFLEYAQNEGISIDDIFDDKKRPSMSSFCNEYYQVTKNDPNAPEVFLRHIKKVGSYISHLTEIIDCACKGKYKDLFSSIKTNLLDSCEEMQPISSWKTIVIKYISDEKYEDFKNTCLEIREIKSRLEDIYGGINKQLESNNFNHTYLHTELNVLTKLMDIDKGSQGRKFIAVSKKCCYLCRLYIKFIQSKGHKFVIFGSHNKLYHKWQLPIPFRKDFIPHASFYLDEIIENEINHLTSLRATSDSDPESENRDYKKIRFVCKMELSEEDL